MGAVETVTPRDADPAVPAREARFAALRRTTVFRTVTAYVSSQSGSHASGLAFNAVMAMFPMIIATLALIGLVVSGPGIQSRAQTAILRAFPGRTGEELSAVITQDLHHYAGLLGIVGLLGLLWAGTNFFSSLEFCLSRIFGIGQRGFLRQRAMGAVMILGLTASLLVAVGANTLVGLVPVMSGLGPVTGFVAMALLSLAIFRLVPNRTFRIAALWPGAMVAGVLIEAVTLLFPLFAKLAHGFDTYGQSLALFFLLATWLSLLSQFLLIGAVWNRVRLGDAFTSSGLLASRAAPATVAAPSPGDAVGRRAAAAEGASITDEVARSTHAARRRSRRPEAASRP